MSKAYSREQVQTVTCPRCWARPGEQCRGRAGLRMSNHRQRLFALERSLEKNVST